MGKCFLILWVWVILFFGFSWRGGERRKEGVRGLEGDKGGRLCVVCRA